MLTIVGAREKVKKVLATTDLAYRALLTNGGQVCIINYDIYKYTADCNMGSCIIHDSLVLIFISCIHCHKIKGD